MTKKVRKRKEKKPKVLRQTYSLLPFLRLEDDYIQLKKGVMDILQVSTKDLYSMNDDDLEILVLLETKFLRSFTDTYKIITINFPANAESQKRYWLNKRVETTDELRLRYIDRKLFEFDFIERERTNREYFFFVYAENTDTLARLKDAIVRSTRQSFPIEEISKQKKIDLLFLLNNQNSKLT